MRPGARDATKHSLDERDTLPDVDRSEIFRRHEWIVSMIAFALAAALSFAVALALSGKQPLSVPVVRGVSPPAAVPLQLRVDPDANGLRLSWNKAAAHAGSPGVLQVRDGETSAIRILDAAQVASGWFIYKPISKNVAFQLSLRGTQGRAEASLQVPDNMLLDPASVQKSTAARENEALAYDEIPHRQRRTISANEAAAYDPKRSANSKPEVTGGARSGAGSQSRTTSNPTQHAPAEPSQTGPAETPPTGPLTLRPETRRQ